MPNSEFMRLRKKWINWQWRKGSGPDSTPCLKRLLLPRCNFFSSKSKYLQCHIFCRARESYSSASIEVWRFAAELFQQKHFYLSKILYEIYINKNPDEGEAMGQYVSGKEELNFLVTFNYIVQVLYVFVRIST